MRVRILSVSMALGLLTGVPAFAYAARVVFSGPIECTTDVTQETLTVKPVEILFPGHPGYYDNSVQCRVLGVGPDDCYYPATRDQYLSGYRATNFGDEETKVGELKDRGAGWGRADEHFLVDRKGQRHVFSYFINQPDRTPMVAQSPLRHALSPNSLAEADEVTFFFFPTQRWYVNYRYYGYTPDAYQGFPIHKEWFKFERSNATRFADEFSMNETLPEHFFPFVPRSVEPKITAEMLRSGGGKASISVPIISPRTDKIEAVTETITCIGNTKVI